MKKVIFLLLLSTCISTTAINAAEVSFTQEDRDRLIRLETKQNEGFKATNQRIDDLRDLVYIVIGGMLGLIGFVLWDRRSALAPAIRKNKELEEREDRLEKILKEYALKEPKLAEVLKSVGLL